MDKSRRHARMILSGIHAFNDLGAGFPTKTASGMSFCEIAAFQEFEFRRVVASSREAGFQEFFL
jgi:hypothetical protein